MRTDPQLRFSPGFEPEGLNLPGRHFQDGVSQSGSERNHLFLASGGSFVATGAISGADSVADGRAVALLDYDRDGWRDLVLVNANAPMFEIYGNRMAALHRGDPTGFVALRFVGGNLRAAPSALSNRDGYGAVVELVVGGRKLIREHRAGEGMAAQNSATMLIGIGRERSVSQLAVTWPSGRVTRLTEITPGALVVAYEDGGDGRGRFETTDYARDVLESLPAALVGPAIDRGRRYFERSVDATDPSWISLFGYMKRRFDFEASLANGEKAHAVRRVTRRPEIFEVFRRIDDPGAVIEKRAIAELPHVIDRITASALHCDRIALPADWIAILGKASRAGGYALTHAVLATEWTVENGCLGRAAVGDLRSEQIHLLSELVDGRADLAESLASGTDLWIEAVVMLYYAGAADSVRAEWIHEVAALQRADGGWPRDPSVARSDPHASALALWALLENDRSAKRIPWLRPAPAKSRSSLPTAP